MSLHTDDPNDSFSSEYLVHQSMLDVDPAEIGSDEVSHKLLKLRHGLRMPRARVPVIYLLNIHDLATHYGLPWDPVPLPGAGDGALYSNANEESLSNVWPAIAWICSMGLLIAVPNRQKLTHTLP